MNRPRRCWQQSSSAGISGSRLGKRYLNPVDIYLLDKLVEQGRIERVKLARPGIIPYTLRYRTIQTSQGAEQ